MCRERASAVAGFRSAVRHPHPQRREAARTSSPTKAMSAVRPQPSELRRSCGVVVPSWNSLHYLRTTLPAIERAAARHGRANIVLVDNGSSDGTAEYVRRHHPRVTVLQIERRSIGAARNLGAAHVTAELLVFVDADCLVADDHLIAADRVMSNPRVQVTGSSYALPDDPGWIELVWHRLHKRRNNGFVRLIPGGNLAITAEAFVAAAGFNEQLVTGEDADLCARLISLGFSPYAAQEIRAAHLGNPKSIAGFYRRNVWHSAGMFGPNGSRLLTQPNLMMFLHGALTAIAVAMILTGMVRGWQALAILAVAQLLAPLFSALFRLFTRASGVALWSSPLLVVRGTLLYWVYYWARIRGILLIAARGAASYSRR